MPESEKPTETIWQKSANIAQVIYIVVGFVVLGGGWAWNQQNAIARLSMQQESQSREFSEFKADVQRQLTRITEKFESFGKDVTEVSRATSVINAKLDAISRK